MEGTPPPPVLHSRILPAQHVMNTTALNNTTLLDVATSVSNSTSDLDSSNYIATLIPDIDDRDEALARVEIATLAIIFVVTVIGNGTVLLALWTRKRYAGRKKLSRMYFFILHLSIADLVTAFLNTLPQLGWDITYRFNGGVWLCKIVKYCQTLGPYLSSYILMATAIDRHQAICYPLTYCSWTSRRSKVMVWLAWATSLAFCIPQVTIFAYQEVAPGINDCWATFPQPWGARAYVTWYSISVFIVPLTVLVVTYGAICRVIWQSAGGELGLRSPRLAPDSPPRCARSRRAPLISRAKINTVKQTVAVIAMYIACSTPFICAQLWATWDPEANDSSFFNGAAFTILTLLSSLNSCVNPWIYLAFNRELPRLLLRHYAATSKNYRSAGTARATPAVGWRAPPCVRSPSGRFALAPSLPAASPWARGSRRRQPRRRRSCACSTRRRSSAAVTLLSPSTTPVTRVVGSSPPPTLETSEPDLEQHTVLLEMSTVDEEGKILNGDVLVDVISTPV